MAQQRRAATLSWEQLELQMTWREQRAYDIICPMVLYGDSAEERVQITGKSVRTIYRHLSRFSAKGFAGLLETAYPTRARTLPMPVRQPWLRSNKPACHWR